MAETDERMQQIVELVERAEGYMSDAEFREEFETQQLRYLQAMSNVLLAISFQNQLIMDLLKAQGEYGGRASG